MCKRRFTEADANIIKKTESELNEISDINNLNNLYKEALDDFIKKLINFYFYLDCNCFCDIKNSSESAIVFAQIL